MCGIAGILDVKMRTSAEVLEETVGQMADALEHRGPDDRGTWVHAEAGIALGHRRLAIVDLSSHGHQPMVSMHGRYGIVFNGELYNYRVLQRELQGLGCHFRGHSDTEVMLAAIETWGIESAIDKTIGMFAFGVWDRQENILWLGRDRLGEKPLYYGYIDDVFLFGSELKALTVHPACHRRINRDALTLLLRHNYIPSPYSIYDEIFKLPPGCLMKVKRWDLERGASFAPFPDSGGPNDIAPMEYWCAKTVNEEGCRAPLLSSEKGAVDQLDDLLRSSVRQQMIADVPLGALLSGGIDSSTVVALMQEQSTRPVRTFTIGFDEKGYNEAGHAKEVAYHLGTEHTELYVTPSEALEVIPKLPRLYDEPFADSSQIPTFLVSQLARNDVTVSLSGDGGDELFGGYTRYLLGQSIWNKLGWMPPGVRNLAARTLTSLSPKAWESVFKIIGPVLPLKIKQSQPGDKLHKLAGILTVSKPESLYQGLVSHWKNPESVVINSKEPQTALSDRARWADLPSFVQRMMHIDIISYLPDDILVKVDRASMSVSLEVRVPLLDHRVVEFAARVPLAMKIRNGQGKWLLRQVLYRYVPERLVNRPKMGFGVPIDAWLRGPLRDWAEDLLDERRLQQEGFFFSRPIRQKWEEHLSGARNWQYYLWDILMFQAWLEARG